MTQLIQSLGLTQLSGGFAGMKPMAAKGANPAEKLDPQELQSLAASLGINPEELTPEMIVALQQWLLGGMTLPQAAEIVLPEDPGTGLNGGFARLLSQSMGAEQGASGKQLPVFDQALEGETAGKPELALTKPSSLLGLIQGQGVDSGGSSDKLFEAMFNRAAASKTSSDELLSAFSSVAGGTATTSGGLPLGAVPMSVAGSPGVGASAAHLSPQLTGSLLSMNLPQTVGAQGWDRAVGERLLWMVKGDQQTAELKITPPNLGPMEVKLTINHDQASVSFVSNHAAVRDALEAAIPRLREMLAQESLQLVNVDVGAQHEREQRTSEQQGEQGEHGEGFGAGSEHADLQAGDDIDLLSTTSPTLSGVGVLDLFV